MLKRLFTILAIGSLALSAVGAETSVVFTYAGNMVASWGSGKAETYDVAIRIKDPSFTGKKITSISAVLNANEGIDASSIWISKELKTSKNKNIPDTYVDTVPVETISIEGLEGDFGQMTSNLETPYVLTDDGIYVGYTISVAAPQDGEKLTDKQKAPLLLSVGDNPESFYLHATRSVVKWMAYNEKIGGSAMIYVTFEGEFPEYSVGINKIEETYAAIDKDFDVEAQLQNTGFKDVTSLDYIYTINGEKIDGHIDLTTPLVPNFTSSTTVSLPLKGCHELGIFDLDLTVTKVNGQDNINMYNNAKAPINIKAFLPTTRPLVEEYTGLRCGYCPRGYVAMEEMKEALGDMFVGMAFHSSTFESGCMVTVPNSNFPILSLTSDLGFPIGDIDRRIIMDPSEFPDYWDSCQKRFAPADVNVELKWADESETEFELESTVVFCDDYDTANYRLAFALVADNLHNESWGQSNSYRGETQLPDTELWNIFAKGDPIVYGLVFNDVVAYFKEPDGIKGSIPLTINKGEELKYTYRINKTDVKNVKNQDFINDDATVHAVAILIDGDTGHAVNCNKSQDLLFRGKSDVKCIEDTAVEVSTEYYNFSGLRVISPTAGIYIKVCKMSDGTIRTNKVVIK